MCLLVQSRQETVWPGMCEAVLTIDQGAWGDATVLDADTDGAKHRVGPHASLYADQDADRADPATPKEKPRQRDERWRGRMVTPTGIEPMFSA